jgi:hypothetical protein
MIQTRLLTVKEFRTALAHGTSLDWVFDNVSELIKENLAFCKEITLHIAPSYYGDYWLQPSFQNGDSPYTRLFLWFSMDTLISEGLEKDWSFKVCINPELEIRKYYEDSETFPCMLLDVPAHLQCFLFP